jgi:peptidoglycan/xylan/chitin deacetylase (PgdA/CDA1 family)
MQRIILSYHQFVNEQSDYRFSRTYDQFYHDIRKKVYDEIHIDDGMECLIKACGMMQEINRRAKLFICTSLIEQKGYCTWEQLKELSRFHDIECHSHLHEWHSKKDYQWQFESISTSKSLIIENIGKAPRYFVGPYNDFNDNTIKVCQELQLINVSGRENILNISK